MRDTSWNQARPKRSSTATPYAWDATTSELVELPLYSLSTWPDGALRSSAKDMGRFLSMVIRGGELDGRRVLQRRSVDRMLTPIVGSDEGGIGMFWGTQLTPDGHKLIGHDGSDPGASTMMLFDANDRYGFVLLTNADNPAATEWLSPDLINELLTAAQSAHASPH